LNFSHSLVDDCEFFLLEEAAQATILRLRSRDNTNRLSRACILSVHAAIDKVATKSRPLIITGNEEFFSVGADLEEIAPLAATAAPEFSGMGQSLMQSIENFSAPVYAAISGYCMGGGLDLALACHHRVASPQAIFGHRGAALGLITGWGGTQRLPRLVGKGRALELFVAAGKIGARRAFEIGLIDEIADDPVTEALERIQKTG
jgi:enoyl-CoA hydratase